MRPAGFVFVGLLLLTVVPVTAAEKNLQEQVEQLGAKHEDRIREARQLAGEGRVREAKQVFLDLAKQQPSPAMSFWAGNELFRMDFERSYELHAEAYAALPDEPFANLEFAMQRHRRGEFAEAIPLYERFLKDRERSQMHALLADCLIRMNRIPEAIQHWKQADFRRSHVGIEKTIHEVYGDLHPFAKRTKLLEKLRGGDKQAAEPLLRQLIFMDFDWWNGRADKAAIQQDLVLIEATLGKESERFRAMACLADVTIASSRDDDDDVKNSKKDDSKVASKVAAILKDAKFILDDGAFPTNSIMAAGLVQVALKHKLIEKEQCRARFGDELWRRAQSEAGDQEALHLLCSLSIGKSQEEQKKLEEFDRYGWDRYHDVRFASSLLVLLAGQERLKTDGEELVRALKEFPDSSLVHQIRLEFTETEAITAEMLVEAIKAEFRHLSIGLIMIDGRRLNSYFAVLEQRQTKQGTGTK
ncbi:MAG: hypothetical protein HZA46_16560 [Planctomycetales bacterium]|nr:hypothetical protein [Planctomycetales bacterium]